MESVIEKAIGWFKDISESSKELTSGNVAHKSCAIRGMANRSAEYLEKHKGDLSVIKWQTGTPKESGAYLITKYNGNVFADYWRVFPNKCDWDYNNKSDVIAWCKLRYIKPYEEETK